MMRIMLIDVTTCCHETMLFGETHAQLWLVVLRCSFSNWKVGTFSGKSSILKSTIRCIVHWPMLESVKPWATSKAKYLDSWFQCGGSENLLYMVPLKTVWFPTVSLEFRLKKHGFLWFLKTKFPTKKTNFPSCPLFFGTSPIKYVLHMCYFPSHVSMGLAAQESFEKEDQILDLWWIKHPVKRTHGETWCLRIFFVHTIYIIYLAIDLYLIFASLTWSYVSDCVYIHICICSPLYFNIYIYIHIFTFTLILSMKPC